MAILHPKAVDSIDPPESYGNESDATVEEEENELTDEVIASKGMLMSIFSFINDDHNLKMTLDEILSLGPYMNKAKGPEAGEIDEAEVTTHIT